MESGNKQTFLRRYESRIRKTNSWLSVHEWYAIYTEKGEDTFLDKLEDAENFTEFCNKYYEILREAFNIDSSGMYNYYEMYKIKFGDDDEGFRNELRQNKEIAKIMKYYF